MAWYRSGTVTVANGSPTITGAGTDFVSNTSIGEVFLGPDGRVYEIAQVVSATQLSVLPIYQGASAGGQTYGIQPTQSFVRDLALNAATLLNTFGAVRDGIGQGLIGDGAPATPGIRFAADQDTGLRRTGPDAIALVAGGQDIVAIDPVGITFNRTVRRSLTVEGAGAGATDTQLVIRTPDRQWHIGQNIGAIGVGTLGFYDVTVGAPRMVLDPAGNLLVGVSAGTYHIIAKATPERQKVLGLAFGSGEFAYFKAQQGAGGSASNVTLWLNASADTGRSINAGGTVNASGADYAEYMTKAAGCGTIAPGDVCGVDRDGHLTLVWADALSFAVKSTAPAYVGGDSWAAHLPPPPEAPGIEPTAPEAPGAAPDRDDPGIDAWREAAAAYPAATAAYTSAHRDWQAAAAAYATALPVWEAAFEAERVKVDRIAFCGQVPVNVTGDFAVGDYLIAAAAGAGIKAVAVPEVDITFDQYRRRLGKVWAVRDGRAWVDVQHG